MNRSYSKIRHIQESNQRLENRLLNEQTTPQTTTGTTPNNTTLKPTYTKPLCNNMSGTYGTGVETPGFKTCVYALDAGKARYIDLRDDSGKVLVSTGGGDFGAAYKEFVSKVKIFYPDKTIGKELPIPIDPDNESASKYYKL